MDTNKKRLFAKWKTPEEKEAFGTKLASARRRKVIKLAEIQKYRCACCGELMFLEPFDGPPAQSRPATRYATLEHIIPQSQGGTDSLWNTVATCGKCNSDRGTMDIMEFYHYRSSEEGWREFRSRRGRLKNMNDNRRNARSADRMERQVVNLAIIFMICPQFAAMLQELYDHAVQNRDVRVAA